ncbi:unnamed protein product [Cylicocyclus nassatus]|uniref:Uncharacterized protein n=1 Tax=Cylicocyclus nassatus TaxID=53992 RepID=A0AA36GP11_CYLNA|nr:unnamed protein product [Cylicocyclus nassatus]
MRQADACTKVSIMNKDEQQYFDEIFEEIFHRKLIREVARWRQNRCDNIAEHMIGNVYVKFDREANAESVEDLDRWFHGAIYAELSPVTGFRELCCRQYELGGCNKKGLKNVFDEAIMAALEPPPMEKKKKCTLL